MERKIAECTTYKELAQTLCNLILFYMGLGVPRTVLFSIIFNLVNDAQDRIDSYELEPDIEEA